MKRLTITKMILHPLLLIIGVIWLYPIIWMLFSSLKTQSEFLDGGLGLLPKIPQWSNYIRAWTVAHFDTYFLNSVIISVACVALVVIICSLMGYAVARVNFPGKNLIMAVYVATIFVPKGYTIVPVYLLIKWLGLTDTRAGVVLVESSGEHIIFILLLIAYFAKIPKELEESAEIDGCGFLQTFFRIMLPLAKPVIATIAIIQFIHAWNAFFVPLIFTLGAPELKTLAVGMYGFSSQLKVDYTGMAAAASIGIIPVVMVFIFFQRYFIEGISGAVKG